MVAQKAGFAKSQRVLKNWEFKKVYRKGRRYHHSALTLVLGPKAKKNVSHNEKMRLGLSVSRKVGNAVVRNYVKRRLREIFRLKTMNFVGVYDIVIVPKTTAAAMSYSDLEEIFISLCKKAGLLENA